MILGLGLAALIGCPAVAQEPRAEAKAQQAPVAQEDEVIPQPGLWDSQGAQRAGSLPPDRGQGTRPLVIWIHGGPWRGGSKDGEPRAAMRLLRRGYAVASINYRLCPSTGTRPDRGLQGGRPGGAGNRSTGSGLDAQSSFGVWGGSATAPRRLARHQRRCEGARGGRFLTRVSAAALQAVCDIFGPATYLHIAAVRPPHTIQHDAWDSPQILLLGGPVLDRKDAAQSITPSPTSPRMTRPS